MSHIKITIVIPEADLHVRKRHATCGKAFKDKTKYSRKAKHKKAQLEDGHSA